MGNLRKIFITRLKEILGDRSAYWLSKESGVPQATLSRILSGKMNPSLDVIEQIAFGLRVDAFELLREPSGSELPPDIVSMMRGQPLVVFEAIRGMLKPLSKR
jgi:transcriptional regulator with XRE-family HTH domain